MTSFDEKILSVVNQLSDKIDSASGSTDSSDGSGSTTITNPFKDKWVSILGDSISTFEGYIPDGNATYYPNDDVDAVSKTWWHKLLTKLGAKLCVNESWSGRWASGTGDKNAPAAAIKLHRVKGQAYINLDGSTETATEDIKPDVILIMVGVNDFKGKFALGSFKYEVSKDATTDFYGAYNYLLLETAGTKYSDAQIYCLDTNYMGETGFLYNNESGVQLQYNEAIENVSKLYGAHYIPTYRIDVNGTNVSRYMIDKIHPKANMMERIANKCYNYMMADNWL